MYSNYFGLKEPSFAITPDPQYLYLSEQHREALAHLLYGSGENGGFVLLTGEVGTGKTTVCRAFLEQLPEGVDVALILNPAMTGTELLRAVCDEFRIEVPQENRTVKCLVDRLNDWLLSAHAAGRRAVLLIDEAQNLRPKVLEQIRLLTNLETAKHKLLQIFLVGQPELRALLEREGLRQLNQRITARYHLRAFDAADTAEYIRHRLAVAGVERQLFTDPAVRLVHRISGGVPRLINNLCDRALLGACVTRSPFVTKRIVHQAAREIDDRSSKGQADAGPVRQGAVLAASLLLAVAVGLLAQSRLVEESFPQAASALLPTFVARLFEWPAPVRDAEPIPESVGEPIPETIAETDDTDLRVDEQASGDTSDDTQTGSDAQLPNLSLARLVDDSPTKDLVLPEVVTDRASAVRRLLSMWGIESGDLGQGDPCNRVVDYGLRCETGRGNWDDLRFFNRPALILLSDPDAGQGYATVSTLDSEFVTLALSDDSKRFSIASVGKFWDGEYLLLWQLPPVGGAIIGPGSFGEQVRWLRKLLSQVPDLAIVDADSAKFDRALEEAVRSFQEREGLRSDGIAGPRTLIRLHDAVGIPEIPRLASAP